MPWLWVVASVLALQGGACAFHVARWPSIHQHARAGAVASAVVAPAPVAVEEQAAVPMRLSLVDGALELTPRIIWTFWDTGEAKLPEFLRICLQSWRHNCPNWRVIVLSPSNLPKFLDVDTDLPSSFFEIDRASLQSDIARVAILARYGGIYADISTLAMSNVAEDVRDAIEGGTSLYSYHNFGWIQDFVAAWFMACKPREPVMVEWSRALNHILDDRVNDHDIHLHPYLRGIDLCDYFGDRPVGPNHPSKCWADYLIVNVALRAVLQRNPRLAENFWRTARLIDHGQGNRYSPTRMFDHPVEVGVSADQDLLRNLTAWPDKPLYVSSQLLQAQDPEAMRTVASAPFVKFFQASKVSSALKRTGLERSSGIAQLVDLSLGPKALFSSPPAAELILPEDKCWVLPEKRSDRESYRIKAARTLRRILPPPGSLLADPFSPRKRPFNRLRLWVASVVQARRYDRIRRRH